MNMKILMATTQEILEDVSDGGKKVSNRNWKLLIDLFGEQNVTLVMYTNNVADTNNVGITNDVVNTNDAIVRLPAYKSILGRISNILSGRIFACRHSENMVVSMMKSRKFDVVFLDRALYGTLVDKMQKAGCDCKIWVFSHNLEGNYFRNKMKRHPILSKIITTRVIKSEKRTVQAADLLFVLTDRDVSLYKRSYGAKEGICLPVSFEDKYNTIKAVPDTETKHLLFIGTMFGPNYDGIKWFVDQVMEKLPEYTLEIVGKNFETKKKELEKKNVTVIGTVNDLEKWYYANNIMIMPIFYGAGQKVKTAEAMMYGKTIIATNEALEGYDVEGVCGIFRCNTEEEFIRTIKEVSLVSRADYRQSVRNQFLEKYSYNSLLNKAKELFSVECNNEWLQNDFGNRTGL